MLPETAGRSAGVRLGGQPLSRSAFDTVIEAAANRDTKAIRWLVERYRNDLIRYAVGNGAPDPEGVTDLIMARVLVRLSELQDLTDNALRTYLFRSLGREINREITKDRANRWPLIGRRHHRPTPATPGFEDALGDSDLIRSLLDELTETQRQVVVGRHFQDRTYEELGRELGLSQAAVRKTSSRAITRLRAAMSTPDESRHHNPTGGEISRSTG